MATVTSKQLAELVAKRLGAETEDASWVLNCAVKVIRELIESGSDVELGDDVIAAMLAAPAQAAARPAAPKTGVVPKAAPAPKTGAVLKAAPAPKTGAVPRPATAALKAAAPAAPAAEAVQAATAESKIDESLKGALKDAGPFSILFVVPAADFFTSLTVGKLSGPRSAVTVAEGVEKAVAEVARRRPDLIVVDANVQGFREFVRDIKTKKEHSLIAIVVLYGEGMDSAKVEGLRIFEDAHISEPFDVADLVRLAESELARSMEERAWFAHEVNFQFQTAEKFIEGANDYIAQLIEQSGLDEEASAATCVAFREAVDNAARHGNRLQAKRLIDVIYLVDKEKVSITVEDEGDGFDTEAYLTRGREGNAVAAARARHEAGRVGGLGIMLMLRCVDDLEYNSVGNKLKLTKFVAA